ncbi:uncharacterized protein BDW43DRAFT_292023, partial [Aspergillus alliaceus]|uniref:uncharacterized protein n=1 Tax=Petromyces alliaceus TaxID=209559 RepID=UPI0012A3D52C
MEMMLKMTATVFLTYNSDQRAIASVLLSFICFTRLYCTCQVLFSQCPGDPTSLDLALPNC